MATAVYRIVITNPGGLAAPDDGFIDPLRMEGYITDFSNPPSDFNETQTQAKRRGNQRYQEIIGQLNLVTNTYIVPTATSTPGGAYNAEPTSLNMTALVEHGDDSLRTQDELNPATVLVGPAAMVRLIARALIAAPLLRTDVYDPTKMSTPGNSTQDARFGQRIAPLTVGAVAANLAAAEAMVSVTPVPIG